MQTLLPDLRAAKLDRGPVPARRSVRRWAFSVAAICFVAAVSVREAVAQSVQPAITSPSKDQVLQGLVTVTGTTGPAGFASAEISFAYAADDTGTWFAIQTLAQPIEDGTLATWDTTKITDGSYVIRLRVVAADAAVHDALVPVIVANYTAPEIGSPTPRVTSQPVVQVPTPLVVEVSVTPLPVQLPTPTALPPNPAVIPATDVYAGLGRGALIAGAAFVLLALILLRRRL